MSSEQVIRKSANTNTSMTEYIKQREGRAIAIFYNSAELSDPDGKQINRPRRFTSSSAKVALQTGRTTQISLTSQTQLAATNPQFAIVRNPQLYSSGTTATPIVQAITLNRTGTQEAFIVKYNTNGSIQWARRINGQGDGVTFLGVGPKQGIITDALGNVYVIGTSLEAAVTIFAQDNTTTAFSLRHAGGGDTFVVKYDTLGTPLWARRLGGTTIHADQGNGIAVDPFGNVYVTGTFHDQGITMFAANDIDTAFTTGATGTGFDGYVAKYNATGTPLWLRRIGGGNTDAPFGIAVDSVGGVFVCGYTQGTVNVFNAAGTAEFTLTLTTTIEGFVVKYDTDGVPKWARRLVRLSVTARAITVDSTGNAYIIGFYNNGGLFTANGGTTTVTLPTSGDSDNAFLVKYDTNGEPLWARAMNGTNTNMFFGISLDSSNNIYIVGRYAGTLVIRNADNSTFLSSAGPGGQWDIGIVKYSSDGTPQWLRRIGGLGFDQGLGIASDSNGNVYVTGASDNSVIVYNGNGIAPAATTFITLPNSGAEDGLIVKYDTSGTPLWATRMSGTGSDISRGIAVDSSANIYATGSYTSNPLTLRTTGF